MDNRVRRNLRKHIYTSDAREEGGGISGPSLTLAAVREFQAIVREESGIEMDEVEAWNRANDLLALYRVMLGPIPEDPGRFDHLKSSSVVPLGSDPPNRVT
jgi:hypothetical protein